MKVLFICGSLEPGKNGVGDYARLLAAQLIELGHHCKILALNELKLEDSTVEFQYHGAVAVDTTRISAKATRADQLELSLTLVQDFDPDWLSLQFVTYSFDARGLCFGISSLIRKLGEGRQVHIMFHELWPLEPNGNLVNIAIYAVQKWIVRALPRQSGARLITTQLPKSQERLRPSRAKLLPLFGNIPFQTDCGQVDTMDESNVLVGIIFGSAPSPEEFRNVLAKLDEITEHMGTKIVLKLLGRNGRHQKSIIAMAREKYGAERVVVCGPLSTEALSCAFSKADFGIAKNTVDKVGKSGSATGMLEHGLPVIVNGRMDQGSYLPLRFQQLLVPTESEVIRLPAKTDYQSMLPVVATQFIDLLQAVPQT